MLIARDAVLSACGRYRYSLTRRWDDALPAAAFIMLNPSTADGLQDDPTIRRCVGFAQQWGCGSLTVVNLFAYRSTSPQVLRALPADEAIGPLNDEAILAALEEVGPAGLRVAAWGTHGALHHRAYDVRRRLFRLQVPLLSIGPLTGTMQPRHPLYLRKAERLQPFFAN